MKARIMMPLLCVLLFTACEKEIDFDYHEIAPLVVVEGRVTNEGTEVHITKSRSVTDSVRGKTLPGATVVITCDGHQETLSYHPADDCYKSAMKGQAGKTYQLSIDFEGKHYESASTMPAPAPIISTQFYWMKVLEERLLVNVLWATDPRPDVRDYYYFRMDRRSSHPHVLAKIKNHPKPYRWNVFDDRGNPPGFVFRDIHCMMERTAEEDKEDDWDRILYAGDTITMQLMTIDQPTYDYFRTLISGQSGGANPISNITGGCLGYFTAASICRSDTLIYRPEEVLDATDYHPQFSGK